MAERTAKAVETWGLAELLQALRQVAQEAGVPEGMLPSPPLEQQHIVRELRAAGHGGSGT
jgi:hypothetical protein